MAILTESPVDALDMVEMKRRLREAYAQLQRYAEDLNSALQESVEKEQDVTRTRKQLQLYARDLKRTLESERARSAELETAHYDTVLRLMLASQYRDDETGEHIRRIVDYVRLLAVELGMNQAEAEITASAAALHDVGKIAIDDAILRKPGPLDRQEWEAMKKHTLIGARILEGSPSPLLQKGHEIALTHHENWDGSGYPRGLDGEEIPLSGRLVMLADRYDALRSQRPYKPAYDHQKTVRIIVSGDGRTRSAHYEPRILELFERVHPELDKIWQTWQTEERTWQTKE